MYPIIPVALWSSGFCNVPRTILCSNDECLADFLLMVTESMVKTMIARTGPRLPGPQLPSAVNNADTTLPSAATNTYTMPGLSAFLAYRQRVSEPEPTEREPVGLGPTERRGCQEGPAQDQGSLMSPSFYSRGHWNTKMTTPQLACRKSPDLEHQGSAH